MTTTNVHYHVEDGVGRPAINVKVRAPGAAYWPDGLEGPFDTDRAANIVETAYQRVQSDFWQAAEEIATQRGLGEIEQRGRSGGWLVFTDGTGPLEGEPIVFAWRDDAEQRAWLAGYRSMVEWADAWIADAPRKVAALAQQLALDEIGERSVALQSLVAFGAFRP